jgi:predicted  nucleic acid-binding Zn-ribbon protein
MVEADDLAAAVKQAESSLAAAQKEIEQQRRKMDEQVARLRRDLEQSAGRRDAILSEISPSVLAIYQSVAPKRKGIGVAEARAGLCTICQVRLRPKIFNDVLRNDTIIQCESCQRILYSVPLGPGAQPAPEQTS